MFDQQMTGYMLQGNDPHDTMVFIGSTNENARGKTGGDGDMKNDGPMIEVCPNCGKEYWPDSKYCRYCGAKYDEPEVRPEVIATIYGPPPVEREHRCTGCGYTWRTCAMLDRERYCPRCGCPASVTELTDEGIEF